MHEHAYEVDDAFVDGDELAMPPVADLRFPERGEWTWKDGDPATTVQAPFWLLSLLLQLLLYYYDYHYYYYYYYYYHYYYYYFFYHYYYYYY